MEYTFALIFFYKIFESLGNFNQIIEPLVPFLLIMRTVLGEQCVFLKDFLIGFDFTNLMAFSTTLKSSRKVMTGLASFLSSEIIFLLVRSWYLNDRIAKVRKEILSWYFQAYACFFPFWNSKEERINAEYHKKRAFQCKLWKCGHSNKANEKVKEHVNECPARWIFLKWQLKPWEDLKFVKSWNLTETLQFLMFSRYNLTSGQIKRWRTLFPRKNMICTIGEMRHSHFPNSTDHDFTKGKASPPS